MTNNTIPEVETLLAAKCELCPITLYVYVNTIKLSTKKVSKFISQFSDKDNWVLGVDYSKFNGGSFVFYLNVNDFYDVDFVMKYLNNLSEHVIDKLKVTNFRKSLI